MRIFQIHGSRILPATRKRPKAMETPYQWAWLALTAERKGGVPPCSQFSQQAYKEEIHMCAWFEAIKRGTAAGSQTLRVYACTSHASWQAKFTFYCGPMLLSHLENAAAWRCCNIGVSL